MKRLPRPRAASIMTPAVIVTVGLAGLFMSVAINLVIVFGKNSYGKAEIGSTMGLVAFSLMLVIAAFESRDEKASILRTETFDNRTLNITALVEIVLAVLIARGGVLTSLLGTAGLTDDQWLIGAAPAVLLLILWELGQGHRALTIRASEARGPCPGGRERLIPTTPSAANGSTPRWARRRRRTRRPSRTADVTRGRPRRRGSPRPR